jgi:hypothetical protein
VDAPVLDAGLLNLRKGSYVPVSRVSYFMLVHSLFLISIFLVVLAAVAVAVFVVIEDSKIV